MKTNVAKKPVPKIDPKLAEALAKVEADAQQNPEAFLDDARVPDGGE